MVARRSRADAEEQPRAIFEGPAIVVGSPIGERREKAVEEVAVGGVDFDYSEAGVEGPERRLPPINAQTIDVLLGHLARLWIAIGKRLVADSKRLPTAFLRFDRLASLTMEARSMPSNPRGRVGCQARRHDRQ